MSDQPNGLISEAFVKAQGELENVGFDATNPGFRSRYATLAAITAATRPVLAKHGLCVRQICVIEENSHERVVTVTTELRHVSGQTLPCGRMTMPIGEGRIEVQAAGSALTYLKRYAWTTALGITGEEDDDGNSAPAKRPRQPERPDPVEEYIPPDNPSHQPKEPAKSDATRMKALHALMAAPGEANRQIVTNFLDSMGWTTQRGNPETWVLEHVPNTPRLVKELLQHIADWEASERANQELPM